MSIRFATAADAAALLSIYAQYISTPITFECELPSVKDFARRIADICQDYPYLVYNEGDRILGYAYAHRHMERAAYQWDAGLSVYLDQSATAKGLGKKLYRALIEILRLQGVRTVYGGVTVPNAKSEALHTSLGFTVIGTYHNTGYKCGQWHDVMWFEKAVAPYDAAPQPFASIWDIDRTLIEAILAKA